MKATPEEIKIATDWCKHPVGNIFDLLKVTESEVKHPAMRIWDRLNRRKVRRTPRAENLTA